MDRFRFNIDYVAEEDGIIYRSVRTEEDAIRSLNFYLDIYVKLEPSSKSLGGYKERHPGMAQQMKEMISSGTCVIAIDPNNDDFVVGIRNAIVIDR